MTQDDILAKLKSNLKKAQDKMKIFANRNRVDEEFKPGDLVFVNLQPYKQLSVSQKFTHKLSKRFYGPYLVIKKVGATTYQL